MEDSIRLGRILGIPIGVHWSVLLIVGLLVWVLATGWFPERVPDSVASGQLVAAVVTAGAFFASLLAHELAHAVVARRHGVEVEGITLWLLGGVARLHTDQADARVELRVAVVGPATSLAIGAVAALAWLLARSPAPTLAGEVLLYLALMNGLLGVFNLLPAFPMDGGRVLRAVVWRRSGDRTTATRRAAAAGRLVGQGLVMLGLVEILLFGLLDGLWLAAIGWFVTQAGRAEESQVLAGAALEGVRVADVMTPAPVTAADWLTVDDFIDRVVVQARLSAYPLVDLDGRLTGLVTLRRLASVPAAARATTRARDVAVPIADVPTARPDEPALALLERLQPAVGSRALVFQDDDLVGIVTPTDMARALEVAFLRRPTLRPAEAQR